MFKNLIGRKVTMIIDGFKLSNADVLGVKDDWIKIKDENGISFVQANRVSAFSILGATEKEFIEKSDLKMFICRNLGVGCDGRKFLSTQMTIEQNDCPFPSKKDCEFAEFTSFEKIPVEIAAKILNNMSTKCPIVSAKAKKGE